MKKIFWVIFGFIAIFAGIFAFSKYMDKQIEAAFRYEPKIGVE